MEFGRLLRVLEIKALVASGTDVESCATVYFRGCEAEREFMQIACAEGVNLSVSLCKSPRQNSLYMITVVLSSVTSFAYYLQQLYSMNLSSPADISSSLSVYLGNITG